MDSVITETPIWLIKDTAVRWEIEFKIHPVQLRHVLNLIEQIKRDKLFEGIEVDCASRGNKVTHILLTAERFWIDLTDLPSELEQRIEEVVEDYITANGGYAAIRA